MGMRAAVRVWVLGALLGALVLAVPEVRAITAASDIRLITHTYSTQSLL